MYGLGCKEWHLLNMNMNSNKTIIVIPKLIHTIFVHFEMNLNLNAPECLLFGIQTEVIFLCFARNRYHFHENALKNDGN